MPARNVNLTGHFDNVIETGLTSGRDDQAKLEWLRAACR